MLAPIHLSILEEMSFQAVKNAWFKRVDSQIIQVVENFQAIISNCQVNFQMPFQFFELL